MKNIKFNYLYRDAGNYKTYGFIIFKNPEKLSLPFIEKEIRKRLIDSEFFEPSKFKIPHLVNKDFVYNNDLDHSWNEFESIEETDENPSSRSINELITT
ncbi:MAG: hypothetical protein Q8L81_05850 [Bacteroidota bacterium]|nr:hypothetical protein [Bacteroidota bacterium]